MVTKRRENGFNLAFLDVMACGLGAVLLILIIVNFNDDTPIPSDEIERLKQELAATQTQSQSLNSSISDQQQETSTQECNNRNNGITCNFFIFWGLHQITYLQEMGDSDGSSQLH